MPQGVAQAPQTFQCPHESYAHVIPSALVLHAYGSKKREHNRFPPYLAPSDSRHEAGTVPQGVVQAPQTFHCPHESNAHVVPSALISAESTSGAKRWLRARASQKLACLGRRQEGAQDLPAVLDAHVSGAQRLLIAFL